MKKWLLALFLLGNIPEPLFAESGVASGVLTKVGSEADVITEIILSEAGGESPLGQQAVANVIWNRARVSGRGPLFEALKPGQFHRRAGLNIDHVGYARAIAQKMLAGTLPDVTNGATHFHSGKTPYWAKSMVFTVQIGRHRFYQLKAH